MNSGYFSFNSYAYYLTRAFNFLTHAFNLLSRAFNLATCAFSLLTRGFELETRGLELVIREFELATHISQLVTRVLHFLKEELDLPSSITTYVVQIETPAQYFFRKIMNKQNKKDILLMHHQLN